MKNNSEVAILMCTYNGEKYLSEQLASFVKQTHKYWSLWVSDDGSSDTSKEIIHNFFTKHRINGGVLDGPNKGFCKNFLQLINNKNISSDFYALSDQDDVWFPEKIEKALDWIKNISSETPAVFCSRTRLVNANNKLIGHSPLFQNKASFENAMVQNIAGGNTMLFNDAAMKLLRKAGSDVDVPVHDWWIYFVVTACGGAVFFDQSPSLNYRQHGHNMIGNATGYQAIISRIKKIQKNEFSSWVDANINSIKRISSDILPVNLQKMDNLQLMRGQDLISRLKMLNALGIYRLTRNGQLALWAGVILNRV